MLEKRKDESEAIGKYQSMLVSVVIAGLIVWIAPILIPVLTGQDFGTSLVAPPEILLEENETVDNLNPNSFGGRIGQLWDLMLWVVRLVLVFAVMIFVVMLRVGDAGRGRAAVAAAETARNSAGGDAASRNARACIRSLGARMAVPRAGLLRLAALGRNSRKRRRNPQPPMC